MPDVVRLVDALGLKQRVPFASRGSPDARRHNSRRPAPAFLGFADVCAISGTALTGTHDQPTVPPYPGVE
jgi:hypothetical protein